MEQIQNTRGIHKKIKVDKTILRSVLFVMWTHLKRYPYTAVVASISLIGIQLVYLVIPLYMKKFFDTIALPGMSKSEIVQLLLGLLFVIGILSTLRWTLHRIFGFANMYLQASVMSDLLETAFQNLLGHSYKFFTNSFTGSLVRKVTRLSRSFEDFTDQITSNIVPIAVISTGILVILFQRSTILGLILLGWVVFFLAMHYFISRWKMKYDRARSEKDSESTGVLSDALTNIITIKLFSNYTHEKSRFRRVIMGLKRLRFIGWGIGEVTDGIQGATMIGIELLLLYVWIKLWQQGQATIGDLVLIQSFLMVLFQRLWDLGRVIRRTYEAIVDAAEMVEILNTPYEVKDRPRAEVLTVPDGKIEFKDVTFGFHKTRNVLKNFNLTIRPGEKIAFVGSSGAGKTTMTSLILRFHDVDGGEIVIDGQNVAHVTQESLRREIALVPQEPILFHRTLKENIRYGRLDAADEEIIDAAKKAHCHEFISRLPYQYDTYVGERGIKLSGGERQRVAIARAILAGTKILILDEATSSLDSEIEALIQDALRNLMQNKTAIVIAHRLSTIVQMDRIIVLEDGKILETGTHNELLSKSGLYKRLWSLQAERFLDPETSLAD